MLPQILSKVIDIFLKILACLFPKDGVFKNPLVPVFIPGSRIIFLLPKDFFDPIVIGLRVGKIDVVWFYWQTLGQKSHIEYALFYEGD